MAKLFTIPKLNILPALKFLFTFNSGWDLLLLIIGILFSILQSLSMPFFLLYFGKLLDSVSEFGTLIEYVKILAYVGLYSFITALVAVFALDVFTSKTIKKLKKAYFLNVIRQEIAFFDTVEPGGLTSNLDIAIVNIRNSLSIKLSLFVTMVGMFFSTYVVAFIIDWRLTLVSSACILFLPVVFGLMIFSIAETTRRSEAAYSSAGNIAEETVTSIRTVVSMNAQQYFINWYDKHIDKARAVMKKFLPLSCISVAATDGVVNAAAALGFWYGGKLILDFNPLAGPPTTTVGDVLTVNFAVITAGFALATAASNFSYTLKGLNSLLSLKETIERSSIIDPLDPSGIKDVDLKGDIEFHNVSFYFPNRPDVWIFRNLSIKIEGGQSIAFVGPSGIGKSTIIQLIQRFYDPVDGYITLDGVPLKQYNIRWLRTRLGIVSQQPRLFSQSISKNIALGSSIPVTQNQIYEAAKDSLAHDFILKFPKGYNSEVGEGGSMLSGGQKQRIAIARALISRPPVLLFDEATSALDTVSEKLVQQTLDKLLTKKSFTCILIAHRLSTIRNADKIIVLANPQNQGAEVVQVGTNEQLLADENGLFYSLMNTQQTDIVESSNEATEISSATQISKQKSELFDETEIEHVPFEKHEEEKPKNALKKFFDNLKKKKEQEQFVYPKYPSWKLFQFMSNDSLYLIFGFISSFFAGVTYPAFGLILAEYLYSMSTFDLKVMKNAVELLPLILLGVAVYGVITTYVQYFCFSMSGENLVRTLRHKVFLALLNQEIEFFDNKSNSPGQLTSILSSDAQTVQTSAGLTFGTFLKSIVTTILGFGIAFWTSVKLAAVTIAAFLLLIPGQIFEQNVMMLQTTAAKEGSPSSIISESLGQIRNVAAYGLEQKMYENYATAIDKPNDFRNAIAVGGSWAYSQGGQYLINALIFWYAGTLIDHGEATSLDVFRVLFVLMFAMMGISQAGVFLGDQRKAALARSRVFGIINRNSKIDPSSKAGKKHTFNQVEAKNLTFHYSERPEARVLNNLNFEIEAGKTYAIVGESGCGKSTIIQLMERFYESNVKSVIVNLNDKTNNTITTSDSSVEEGGLFYSGENLKDINIKHMRNQLGLVSQEPVLFNTSITENIRMGKIDATEEEIIAATKISNAYNFISLLPDKFETTVGRMGELLSGGQKQRVVIARTIIKNPHILLLDEATSALDNESEKIVQEALDDLMSKHARTTVVIAHRLSTIRNADKIIVLKPSTNLDGSYIIEAGSHDELIELKGEYFKLCSSQ